MFVILADVAQRLGGKDIRTSYSVFAMEINVSVAIMCLFMKGLRAPER